MTRKRQKLELTWVGKDEPLYVEPRILIHKPKQSYQASAEDGLSDNLLIHGENLLVLKALERDYTGKIKCIYIDPPYNTGHLFDHYDDGLEHSEWLQFMRPRLEIMRRLLTEDGSIWISIDDDECHYLKVLCDEVFGRENFVANVIWQKKYAPQNDARYLSDTHDHLLVYVKNLDTNNRARWLLPRSEEMDARYKNPDNDPRGPWQSDNLLRKDEQTSGLYTITTPSGRKCVPPKGTSWRLSTSSFQNYMKDSRIWFGADGNNVPRLKRFISEVQQGVTAKTLWLREEVGDNQEAKREARLFNEQDVFQTPKPERLIHRILHLATEPGDIVLDCFAGSGTTGAVAHKMGRRWIMVELGDHCHTHIIPRLKQVIDGTDQGGISKMVDWQGGGGYRYAELAPSLVETDDYGNPVINSSFDPYRLAEAVCAVEGYKYAPNPDVYWMHGYSSERHYVYVTTQFMTRAQLDLLSEEVGDDRSLAVYCKAFRIDPDEFPNLQLKKIPTALLSQCEWEQDGYSFRLSTRLTSIKRRASGSGAARHPRSTAKRGNKR
jgi:adenine-specific DNA-methyltransferase